MAIDVLTLTDENIQDLIKEGVLEQITFYDWRRIVEAKLEVIAAEYTESVSSFRRVISFEEDPNMVINYYRIVNEDTGFYLTKKKGDAGYDTS